MTEETSKAEQTEEVKDEVKESPTEASKTNQEKTLTQSEVNKLMAEERRKHEKAFKELQTEYLGYKQTIEEREKKAQDAAAEKVEALRKDLPEAITKLLDKLTPIEQLDWLSDPENVVTKKEIPPLPPPRENGGAGRKSINIV